ASEQQALVEAVVVPETWFFRYPESFAALVNLARERSTHLAGARPLRILSLPCSTGEEPYSIAMALLDGGLPGDGFRIDAMDISEVNLQRAERALYGRNSFRGDDLSFRDRHFAVTPEGFELRSQVRRKVRLLAG
ncbi:MAG: chemotaxis protein CheR, partial [Xanthomonas perforans]|nr:chemotaxis protein CheR [Xanthomonas perforans]